MRSLLGIEKMLDGISIITLSWAGSNVAIQLDRMEPNLSVRRRVLAASLIGSLIGVCACAGARKDSAPKTAAKPVETAAKPVETAAPVVVPPEVVEGARLYVRKGCVMCHGRDAKGGVKNRYSRSKLIPALDKVGEGYSEEEFKDKVNQGVSKVAKADPDGHVAILVMPSWKDKLASEELDKITAYLFSLAPEGSDDEDDF